MFFARLLLARRFYKKVKMKQAEPIDEANYTIVQPILSGDIRLEKDLTSNLKNTREMHFIWLVDKSDLIAQETTARILVNAAYQKRVEILLVEDVSEQVNPKVYKLAQAVSMVNTKYLIVLDDDTVIDFTQFNEMSRYEKRKEEWIVTGIPYNHGQYNFWSKLVAAFVNSNSLLTYFTLAEIKQNHSINGMFYIVPTAIVRKYSIFEEIQYQLCDDLAIATYLSQKNVTIIQSSIFCNVRTTLTSGTQYLRLMKRWLLFATIYLKKNASIQLYLLLVIPTLFPFLLLACSFFLGFPYFLLTVSIFFLKAIILTFFRRRVTRKSEGLSEIIYEVLNECCLPLLYIYNLVTPPVILWRNKKIRVTGDRIHYE